MSKQLFYSQLKEQEKELSEALSAVRALMNHYESDGVGVPQVSLEFKEAKHNKVAINDGEYNKNAPISDKVFYSLKQIGSGYVDDVLEILVSLDSSFSKDRAKKACTIHLSKLYRADVIGASKSGRKYKYYIKKEA